MNAANENGKLTWSGPSVSLIVARAVMDAIDDGSHWSICLHDLDPTEIPWIAERLREAGATTGALVDGGTAANFSCFDRLYMWPRSDA